MTDQATLNGGTVDEENEKSNRTLTLGTTAAFVIGFLTMGIGLNQSGEAATSLILLVPLGLFVLPPVRRWIEEEANITFSRWLVGAIWIGVYGISQVIYQSTIAA